jgi:hypothetical protein
VSEHIALVFTSFFFSNRVDHSLPVLSRGCKGPIPLTNTHWSKQQSIVAKSLVFDIMAEFAGSIIGIIAAGTKVAMVLSQLASDIGSAGQEARMIGSEIRTFCTILGTLKDTMDKIEGSSYYAHCFSMMRGITDASVEMFTEILNAAETLRDMTTGKDGRDGKFKLVSKVQWAIFQKPKIMVLRAAIEAYKSNIALMLGTINVVEKVARRTSVYSVKRSLYILTQIDHLHTVQILLLKTTKSV